MKKQIKLTENDLHRMIKESVYRVLNEGTTDSTDMDAWERCKEMVGADTMLSELENWLDVDSYHEFLEIMSLVYLMTEKTKIMMVKERNIKNNRKRMT